MKNLILLISVFFSIITHSQDEFIIRENGLNPKFSVTKINSLTKAELYQKTLVWINDNEKKFNLSLGNKKENETIDFYSIKTNAIHLNKQYFNVRYKIGLNFNKGQLKFEPTEIQLKINSKYDMGWKDFDLDNTNLYFKKGKLKRKYKSYLKDLTILLNKLKFDLNEYLRH